MLSRNNSVLQLWVNNKKTTCIQSNMIQYIYWCVSTRDYRTMAAINDPQANTCHGYKELHNITDHRTMIAVKVQLTKKPTHYLAAHCYIIPQHYDDNAKIICRNRNIWCIHEHQQIIVSKGIKEVYKETMCGVFTGHLWNPLTKASDTEFWCFHLCATEQTVKQTTEIPVIWDVMAIIVTAVCVMETVAQNIA